HEWELRRQREPGLGAEEYLRRFPQHQDVLAARLGGASATPPPAGRETLAPDRTVCGPGQAPAIDSVPALVQALRGSQLLAAGQQEELARLQGAFAEPRGLARELLRRDWLTAFQVNQLFQGRQHQLVLGPYVLLEKLGEGGMGTVFRARHRLMD